jgi:hypothetical protein
MKVLKQDTTSSGDVNQADPTGRLAIYKRGGADEADWKDGDRDKMGRADLDASRKGRAIMRLQSMPNGEYPIRNAQELKAVIREWQTGLKTVNYSGFEIQRHVIRRARDLKLVSLLPSEWGVNLEIMLAAIKRKKSEAIHKKWIESGIMNPTSENEEENLMAEVFQSFLLLEGEKAPLPLVLEDKGIDGNGTMKVKVPFYIGNSITNAPGFTKKIFFPTSLLQEIVQEGKNDIKSAVQPLTVYARHAHAADASYLPIGGVVDLIAEGSVGYAVLEIEPTTYGKDTQILLRGKKLNAVSLRSGKSNFEMQDVEVNGEKMLTPKKLKLSGIDFAPDSPAMKTYGVEVLAAENVSVKLLPNKKEESSNNVEKLTLEMVKDHPEIISEIERPLVERIDTEVEKNKGLEKEIGDLKAELSKVAVEKFAREVAAKHPKPEEALPILLEVAATCKTTEEFSAKTFPILLEALSANPKMPVKVLTDEEKLRKLFGVGGENGKGTLRTDAQGDNELEQEEEEIKGEHVGALEIPQ